MNKPQTLQTLTTYRRLCVFYGKEKCRFLPMPKGRGFHDMTLVMSKENLDVSVVEDEESLVVEEGNKTDVADDWVLPEESNKEDVNPSDEESWKLETKNSESTDLALSDAQVELAGSEDEYRKQELIAQSQEMVKAAVAQVGEKQVIKLRNEVNDALNEEVGTRLNAYEKRRNRREARERTALIIRLVVIIVLIVVILCIPAVRNRLKILFTGVGNTVNTVVNGGDATDDINKLKEDMNQDMQTQYVHEDGTPLTEEELRLMEIYKEKGGTFKEVPASGK